VPQPSDSDPLTYAKPRHTCADLIDVANNLMTRNKRRLMQREIPLHDMNVRAADRAHAHFHSHFAHAGLRFLDLARQQWCFLHRLLLDQDHRAHPSSQACNHFMRKSCPFGKSSLGFELT
jgi:hypothetical protein